MAKFTRKRKMIVAVVICALLAGAAVVCWSSNQKEIREQKQQSEILAYITKHPDGVFDHQSAIEYFGLTYDQWFDYLMKLEQAGRIKGHPNPWPYIRKPILITLDDKLRYYWKISVRDDEKAGETVQPPGGESGEN